MMSTLAARIRGGRGVTPLSGRGAVRVLASARFTSVTGSQAAQTALAYDVYHRTGSAAWAGAVLIATAGVAGLAGPLSGWIGDRIERRSVMVASELAAAAVWAAMLLTATPTGAIVGALLGTAVNAPFRAASNAAVADYVPAPDRPWAYGVISTAFSAALVGGPLLGGWVVAGFGPRPVFAMNAVTFFVSAALLCALARTGNRPLVRDRSAAATERRAADVERSAAASVLAGYSIVWREPAVRRLFSVAALSFAAFGIALVADLPLVDLLGAGPIGYAAITTGWGAGAIGGSVIAARAMNTAAASRWLAVGTAGMAFALAALAAFPNIITAVLLSVVGGVGNGCAAPAWSVLLQRAAPEAVRGRVFAAAETAEQSAFVGGLLAAGPLVTALGARITYLVPAAVLLAAAVVAAPSAAARCHSLRARSLEAGRCDEFLAVNGASSARRGDQEPARGAAGRPPPLRAAQRR